jgi:hypothetical protein
MRTSPRGSGSVTRPPEPPAGRRSTCPHPERCARRSRPQARPTALAGRTGIPPDGTRHICWHCNPRGRTNKTHRISHRRRSRLSEHPDTELRDETRTSLRPAPRSALSEMAAALRARQPRARLWGNSPSPDVGCRPHPGQQVRSRRQGFLWCLPKFAVIEPRERQRPRNRLRRDRGRKALSRHPGRERGRYSSSPSPREAAGPPRARAER